MAATIKSKRVAEFKAIYQKELGTFWTKYASLFGLLGMNSLSLVNRRWAEKRIQEMQIMFAGNSEQLAKLDELNARNEAAKQRYDAQLAKKEAKKAAKKGWRFGRPPKTASAPEPTPTPVAESRRKLWESIAEGTNATNRT